MQKNGVWKYIATAAVAVLLSGATFWMAFARNTPTREEMQEAIASAPHPYTQDQKLVLDKLDDIEERVKRIEGVFFVVDEEVK